MGNNSSSSNDFEMYQTTQAVSNAVGVIIDAFQLTDDLSTSSHIPLIYNAAFAIELNLKAILKKDGLAYPTNKDGHNIKHLFDILPDEHKSTIQSHIYKYAGEDVNFDKELEHIQSAFVDWRYWFEKGELQISIMFLLHFLDATCDLAEKLYDNIP